MLPRRAFRQGWTLPLRLSLYCGDEVLTDADVAAPRIVELFRNGDPLNADWDEADVDIDLAADHR